jgi:hypothetical protein
MSATELVLAPQPIQLSTFALNESAIQLRETALASAALVLKVENGEQQIAAVTAQRSLKEFIQLVEKERVRLKEPALQYGRDLDRACAKAVVEAEQELGRVKCLVSDFQLAEQRRVREEEEKQRQELARIEAEKQAELKRIADEQARIEQEAANARREAERLACEAKTKKERAAAEQARLAAEAKAKAAAEQAAQSAVKMESIETKAAEATYIESRPVQATKVQGQQVRHDWEITVTNPYELAKYHPDCVTITPLLGAIKAALNQGREIKGVKATPVLKADVRVKKAAVVEV